MKINDRIKLSNGYEMPAFGLGVFRSHEGREVESAVKCALTAGYRSIDTAMIYQNECGVGQAIRDSGLERSDVFVTTKVWNTDQGYDTTLRAFELSMEKLNLGYVDLYLVHWPVAEKNKDTWRALEELYEQGLVRAIGVSNFLPHHLEELLKSANVPPMVNQVEFHPFLQQPELQECCRENGIVIEAWAPIMRGQVLQIPPLVALARKYRKTAVQITLRWLLQKGIVAIPKSANPERIRSNSRIFDFEISELDMSRIDSLDRNHRIGPHPDHRNF